LIVGFSSIAFKRFDGETFELMTEAVYRAVEMAGLSMKDIDGIITNYIPGAYDGKPHLRYIPSQVGHYLGVKARYVDTVDIGGASVLSAIYRAYKAVRAGEAENVLCIFGGKSSKAREFRSSPLHYQRSIVQETPFDEYLVGIRNMSPISEYALIASVYKHVYGVADEQRALVAVKQRYNALSNEKAIFRNPITIQDVLGSRIVSDPLHLLEIAMTIDSFYAFIVGKKISRSGLREIDILYYREYHRNNLLAENPDITYSAAVESAKDARQFLNNVDAFQLYDAFTIMVMMLVEDIGLVDKGKSGKFFESTDTTYKGETPINTGGGSLNVGQTAYMSGPILLEEALLQLNNMATGHQVKGANMIFITALGGAHAQHAATMVLGERKW
jgi:acetyl-CoA acetyltransferase